MSRWRKLTGRIFTTSDKIVHFILDAFIRFSMNVRGICWKKVQFLFLEQLMWKKKHRSRHKLPSGLVSNSWFQFLARHTSSRTTFFLHSWSSSTSLVNCYCSRSNSSLNQNSDEAQFSEEKMALKIFFSRYPGANQPKAQQWEREGHRLFVFSGWTKHIYWVPANGKRSFLI